jgi:UDP-glucose 4-epimerase
MELRVFVTGGGGFIGSYLIPKLLDRGYKVAVFDVASSPRLINRLMPRIEYMRGDLGSKADLYKALMNYRPNGILHLGAILAGACEENPLRCFQTNFESTQVLLEASLSLKIEKFLLMSSIAVFGRDAMEPVTDSAAKNPENIYGQTKLASEHLMLWYGRNHGLNVCGLRPTLVFGPGRTTGLSAQYTSRVLDSIAWNEPIVVSNPDQKGDWLYVKDAVKAILAAWDASLSDQRIFNIAGSVHTVREVVEIAKRLRPDARVSLEENAARSLPYAVVYDDSAARRVLHYAPDYTIEAAVADHLNTVSEMQDSNSTGDGVRG